MSILEIVLIGIGLSMDAFAVSICKGLCMNKVRLKNILVIATFFGFFQAIMPVFGYLFGYQFKNQIGSIDHWIAFILLLLIGSNMIYGAFKNEEEKECEYKFKIFELFILAIATSIDAMAVGVSFAFFDINIVFAATVIGVITFLLSNTGVLIGFKYGSKYEKKATLLGGGILILIGTKILLTHTGII